MKNILFECMARQLIPLALLWQLIGCGNWVGNPKQDEEDEGGREGAGKTAIASSGDMLLHRVNARAGEEATIQYSIKSGANLLANDSQSFEISVVDSSGVEKVYSRKSAGESSISFQPDVEGEYSILIKNNGSAEAELDIQSSTGLEDDIGLSNATEDAVGDYKDVVIKAVITFARECKTYTNGGNSTAVTKAAEGSYFIQPFVFMGKVDPISKKVEPLSQATISIVSGTTSLELKKISDFDLSVFREHGSLTKEQHVVFTRNFYSGYFGAAGEMYTSDTFRFGGDCAKAPVFALPKDLGTASVTLKIVDGTLNPPLDTSFPVRPTASTSFTMYEKDGKKLDNWDPCSYDPYTAIPYNYNNTNLPCRKLSYLDAPYITLDDKMPSETVEGSLTKVSDPTRILYYGHSVSKEFQKALIDKQDDIRNGLSSLTIESCLNNGGIHAVPLGSEKTYLPLKEFNTRVGDLIQLARKTGSYTALKDFYQGNISNAGSIDYATCVPNSASRTSCDTFKVIKVQTNNCSIKADSGISTSSTGDSFIYPSYYEMQGEVVD